MKYTESSYKEWKKQRRRFKHPCYFCQSNDVDFKKRYFVQVDVGSPIQTWYVFCNSTCFNCWMLS
jgi:hypothetical protein